MNYYRQNSTTAFLAQVHLHSASLLITYRIEENENRNYLQKRTVQIDDSKKDSLQKQPITIIPPKISQHIYTKRKPRQNKLPRL